MKNKMIISDRINKNVIKDYENKLFKSYDTILKKNEKKFIDKDFQLIMFKQRYNVEQNCWINDRDENFENVVYDDGYKCIVTFALYKKSENVIIDDKKVMNSYYVSEMMKRSTLDKKWVVKYYSLNNDVIKDIEYYYVLTSTL